MTTGRHIAAFGAAAVLVGCLFPSFDGLKGNDVDEKEPPADTDSGASSTSSSSSSSSTSSSTSSSSSSGAPIDAGHDTGAVAAAKVRCKDLQCDVATSFCCVANDSTTVSCRAKSAGTANCLKVIECDGTQDCATGQSCCGVVTGETKCKAGGCDTIEVVMCQKDAPLCPTGSCKNGTVMSAAGFTLDICK